MIHGMIHGILVGVHLIHTIHIILVDRVIITTTQVMVVTTQIITMMVGPAILALIVIVIRVV
jgi:hypothetical protein